MPSHFQERLNSASESPRMWVAHGFSHGGFIADAMGRKFPPRIRVPHLYLDKTRYK